MRGSRARRAIAGRSGRGAMTTGRATTGRAIAPTSWAHRPACARCVTPRSRPGRSARRSSRTRWRTPGRRSRLGSRTGATSMRAAMESRVGFHVTCTDCHARSDAGLARPDHAACARCHAPEVALAGAPRMADCAACHEQTQPAARAPAADPRRPALRSRAPHGDRRGGTIRCEDCHTQTVERRRVPRSRGAAGRELRRLPRRLRPHAGGDADADLRDLPPAAHRDADRRSRRATTCR